MIRFNSYNYSSLFGSGSNSMFSNSIYNNLSQLSSIRSGAYSKALKAYYGKNTDTSSTQKNSASNKNKYSDTYIVNSDLSKVSKVSNELVSSAKKLSDSGKDNLFISKEKYDLEAAFNATNTFIKDYNETLNSVSKTNNTVVRNASDSMTRMTGIMSKSLSNIGITVGSDGRLSINESDFKNADFDRVKSILGTNGSYARIIGSSAQRLNSASEQQSRFTSNNTGIYGKYGSSLGYYGFSGTSFNTWF